MAQIGYEMGELKVPWLWRMLGDVLAPSREEKGTGWRWKEIRKRKKGNAERDACNNTV